MITNDILLDDAWSKVQESLRSSGLLPEPVLEFFKGNLISIDEDLATLKADMFINYQVMNENKSILEDCLEEVTGKRRKIRIIQKSEFDEQAERVQYKNNFLPTNVDPDQKFENFVVGKSNSQANLAAINCARKPGGKYNPLMIYGESGLGKTHLLNAIANRIHEIHPELKVRLINSGDFVDGVYKSSTENRFAEFKDAFSNTDVLLVDDIQFIAGKPKTQELFFSVFNEMVNNCKQVCITCDRIPEEIKGLDNRMLTRFSQGLNINIEAPEYETAISILKMEIQNSEEGYAADDIDEDVYNFLAANFSSNVRSLKGHVNRLLFYSINYSSIEDHGRITLKTALEAFKDQIKTDEIVPNIIAVRKAVCDYYGLSKQQIISKNRTKNISIARQIAMYLCRKHVDATYEEIGREFGGRDHSTVLGACEKIDRQIKTDALLVKAISEIESQLKQ